jgi:hypothetical protein
MKSLRIHSPVFLLLLAITFAAFGRLLTAPFHNALDLQILQEAHQLSKAPLAMLRHIATYFNQPALQLSFMVEYHLFCLSFAGYMAVNLLMHSLNAFVVYMLVNMLFNRRGMAILSAVLFALAVGNYGKIFMSVAGFESLLLAHLYLLVLYFLIRNDFRHDGRLRSPYFALGLGLFLLASLTKATTFSILGCLLAYKFFFYRQRGGRAIFSRNVLVLIIVGLVFFLAQGRWGHHPPSALGHPEGALHYTVVSFKNVFRYLNLMIFPLQPSPLVEHANPVVQMVYEFRTVIRVTLTIAIVSFSFFGIVFGGRALRFFIAWTYITVLPFTSVSDQGGWLNLTHLYLTSLGFCIILAAGAIGTSNLLEIRRWRRYLPYGVPLFFAVLSVSVAHQIDTQNRRSAQRTEIVELRAQTEWICRHDAHPEPDPGAPDSPNGLDPPDESP